MEDTGTVEQTLYGLDDLLIGVATQREYMCYVDDDARKAKTGTLQNTTFKWDKCTLANALYYATSEVKTRKGQKLGKTGRKVDILTVNPPGVRAPAKTPFQQLVEMVGVPLATKLAKKFNNDIPKVLEFIKETMDAVE